MKSVINPLLWFLLLQTVGLYKLRRYRSGQSRILPWLLVILSMILGMASTRLTRHALEASLHVASNTDNSMAPAYIFVLGGGYQPGNIFEEDVLAMESQRRIQHAVTLWHQFPNACIVLSGAVPENRRIRDPDRHAQLMEDVARCRGVPASAILLEPHSINTREHPVEALKLPGVTPTTPIGVVTSDWHMRRAQQEFCRYFQQVAIYPVPRLSNMQGMQSLIPAADVLGDNTVLLREWVGILWYELLSLKM